jgi:hypothetical protein
LTLCSFSGTVVPTVASTVAFQTVAILVLFICTTTAIRPIAVTRSGLINSRHQVAAITYVASGEKGRTKTLILFEFFLNLPQTVSQVERFKSVVFKSFKPYRDGTSTMWYTN